MVKEFLAAHHLKRALGRAGAPGLIGTAGGALVERPEEVASQRSPGPGAVWHCDPSECDIA